MASTTQVQIDQLIEQLALADTLLAGRAAMMEPQELPGRYGRVVRAIDHTLAAIDCSSVVAGGWAVWRHGFVNRVTQDIDIVLPADRIQEFLQVCAVSGFNVLSVPTGRWPKLHHVETGIDVDILPEGERPGRPPDFAPTTIPSPKKMGVFGNKLRYLGLIRLIELKVAAGRLKDKLDVVELIRVNPDQVDSIRDHLASIHQTYVNEFEMLVVESQADNAI